MRTQPHSWKKSGNCARECASTIRACACVVEVAAAGVDLGYPSSRPKHRILNHMLMLLTSFICI